MVVVAIRFADAACRRFVSSSFLSLSFLAVSPTSQPAYGLDDTVSPAVAVPVRRSSRTAPSTPSHRAGKGKRRGGDWGEVARSADAFASSNRCVCVRSWWERRVGSGRG